VLEKFRYKADKNEQVIKTLDAISKEIYNKGYWEGDCKTVSCINANLLEFSNIKRQYLIFWQRNERVRHVSNLVESFTGKKFVSDELLNRYKYYELLTIEQYEKITNLKAFKVYEI
jgi:hypothetical protein